MISYDPAAAAAAAGAVVILWGPGYAGSHLLVRGLLLRNAVLPSWQLVNSGLALPVPLAFNVSSSNTSLLLLDCTLSTSCDNLAQFATWVGRQPSVNAIQVWGCCTIMIHEYTIYIPWFGIRFLCWVLCT